jgi:hypothetical protein
VLQFGGDEASPAREQGESTPDGERQQEAGQKTHLPAGRHGERQRFSREIADQLEAGPALDHHVMGGGALAEVEIVREDRVPQEQPFGPLDRVAEQVADLLPVLRVLLPEGEHGAGALCRRLGGGSTHQQVPVRVNHLDVGIRYLEGAAEGQPGDRVVLVGQDRHAPVPRAILVDAF